MSGVGDGGTGAVCGVCPELAIIYMYVYLCMCVYMCMYMCIYIHINVYIYKYTYHIIVYILVICLYCRLWASKNQLGISDFNDKISFN